MAKLWFKYGAMGCSKTAIALMTAFNYEEKGLTPLVCKPQLESRDGERTIKSRIGLSRECKFVEEVFFPEDHERTLNALKGIDVVIVDEVQFCKQSEVKEMWKVVQELKIPVITHGLSTDFMGKFFPASETLMAIADEREFLRTVCWCGDGARCNARLDEKGNVLREGEQIQLGGNDTYVSLCQKHFDEGDIGPKMRAKFQAMAAARESEEKEEDPSHIEQTKPRLNMEFYDKLFQIHDPDEFAAEYENVLSNDFNVGYADFVQKQFQLSVIGLYGKDSKTAILFDMDSAHKASHKVWSVTGPSLYPVPAGKIIEIYNSFPYLIYGYDKDKDLEHLCGLADTKENAVKVADLILRGEQYVNPYLDKEEKGIPDIDWMTIYEATPQEEKQIATYTNDDMRANHPAKQIADDDEIGDEIED